MGVPFSKCVLLTCHVDCRRCHHNSHLEYEVTSLSLAWTRPPLIDVERREALHGCGGSPITQYDPGALADDFSEPFLDSEPAGLVTAYLDSLDWN